MIYGYTYIEKWEMGCSTPPYFVDSSSPHVEICYVPSLEDKNA